MGIRFYCPNGHKLNVKEFQAGRKGICPFCGVKMQIPLESTRPSSKRRRFQSQDEEGEVLPDPDAAVDETPPPTADSPTSPFTPAAGLAIVSPPEPDDPLTESGEAVWYVRPASGGQYGPATAEIMRTWLAEGRIAARTLVWREGWRDWREAEGVFPQLARNASIPGLENLPPEPIAASLHPRPAMRRGQDRTTQYVVICGMIAVVLLLFTILILILANQ